MFNQITRHNPTTPEFQMSWYEDRCLPWVIGLACSSGVISGLRTKVVPLAQGRVLEVGFGAGHNLPFYDEGKVEMIYAVEPSEGMRQQAAGRLKETQIPVQLLPCPAEEIPLPDLSIDSVLITFTLCTITDWHAALREMHRLLVPGGRIIFCEHGLAPEQRISCWQNRINPYWSRIAGGCNLNRSIPQMLTEGGFSIETLEAEFVKGAPKVAGYVYRGTAVKS